MHQPTIAEPAKRSTVGSTDPTNISKRIIFTMGGKGGVGKTSFVRSFRMV